MHLFFSLLSFSLKPIAISFSNQTILLFTMLPCRTKCGGKKPRKFRFLELPGEIRNQIYVLHLSDFRAELMRDQCQLPLFFPRCSDRYDLLHPVLPPRSGAATRSSQECHFPTPAMYKETRGKAVVLRNSRPRERTVNRALFERVRWATSLSAILLVSKQVYAETRPILYALTTFVFSSASYLDCFLRAVPKSSLAFITKLELHHNTYGDPQERSCARYKTMYDERWLQSCRFAARQLSGLRRLTLFLHVSDRPLRFQLQEPWVRPLLGFRKHSLKLCGNITVPKYGNKSGLRGQLEVVNVRLSSTLTGRIEKYQSHPPGWRMSKDELSARVEELHRGFAEVLEKVMLGCLATKAIDEYRSSARVNCREIEKNTASNIVTFSTFCGDLYDTVQSSVT